MGVGKPERNTIPVDSFCIVFEGKYLVPVKPINPLDFTTGRFKTVILWQSRLGQFPYDLLYMHSSFMTRLYPAYS